MGAKCRHVCAEVWEQVLRESPLNMEFSKRKNRPKAVWEKFVLMKLVAGAGFEPAAFRL
jgi:hypothetical protein